MTAWSGRSVEQRVTRRLAPGKHVVELHASAEAQVHGLIGIKDAVISRCAVDEARLIERPAAPDLASMLARRPGCYHPQE